MQKVFVGLIVIVLFAACGSDDSNTPSLIQGCLDKGGVVQEDEYGNYDGCLYGPGLSELNG